MIKKYNLGWYRKEYQPVSTTAHISLFQLIKDWWKNNRCITKEEVEMSWNWHETMLDLDEGQLKFLQDNLTTTFMPIISANGESIKNVRLILISFDSLSLNVAGDRQS